MEELIRTHIYDILIFLVVIYVIYYAAKRLFGRKEITVLVDTMRCRDCGWEGKVGKYDRKCRKCGSPDMEPL